MNIKGILEKNQLFLQNTWQQNFTLLILNLCFLHYTLQLHHSNPLNYIKLQIHFFVFQTIHISIQTNSLQITCNKYSQPTMWKCLFFPFSCKNMDALHMLPTKCSQTSPPQLYLPRPLRSSTMVNNMGKIVPLRLGIRNSNIPKTIYSLQ